MYSMYNGGKHWKVVESQLWKVRKSGKKSRYKKSSWPYIQVHDIVASTYVPGHTYQISLKPGWYHASDVNLVNRMSVETIGVSLLPYLVTTDAQTRHPVQTKTALNCHIVFTRSKFIINHKVCRTPSLEFYRVYTRTQICVIWVILVRTVHHQSTSFCVKENLNKKSEKLNEKSEYNNIIDLFYAVTRTVVTYMCVCIELHVS